MIIWYFVRASGHRVLEKRTEKQQEFNSITPIRQIVCPHTTSSIPHHWKEDEEEEEKTHSQAHHFVTWCDVERQYQRWNTLRYVLQGMYFSINHLHSQLNQRNVVAFCLLLCENTNCEESSIFWLASKRRRTMKLFFFVQNDAQRNFHTNKQTITVSVQLIQTHFSFQHSI